MIKVVLTDDNGVVVDQLYARDHISLSDFQEAVSEAIESAWKSQERVRAGKGRTRAAGSSAGTE